MKRPVSDATNPAYITTIPLPGNTGAAMHDDIIYANQGFTLAAFRLHADGSLDTIATICGELHQEWEGRMLGDDVYGASQGCMGCKKEVLDMAPTAPAEKHAMLY